MHTRASSREDEQRAGLNLKSRDAPAETRRERRMIISPRECVRMFVLLILFRRRDAFSSPELRTKRRNRATREATIHGEINVVIAINLIAITLTLSRARENLCYYLFNCERRLRGARLWLDPLQESVLRGRFEGKGPPPPPPPLSACTSHRILYNFESRDVPSALHIILSVPSPQRFFRSRSFVPWMRKTKKKKKPGRNQCTLMREHREMCML